MTNFQIGWMIAIVTSLVVAAFILTVVLLPQRYLQILDTTSSRTLLMIVGVFVLAHFGWSIFWRLHVPKPQRFFVAMARISIFLASTLVFSQIGLLALDSIAVQFQLEEAQAIVAKLRVEKGCGFWAFASLCATVYVCYGFGVEYEELFSEHKPNIPSGSLK